MLSNFLYQYIYFCNILIVVKWSITQKHQDVFASPLFGSIFHLRKHSCTWRRKWQTTPVFLPGESHGQKSLEGYNPQDHEELDTTEVTQHIYSCIPGFFILSPMKPLDWIILSSLLVFLLIAGCTSIHWRQQHSLPTNWDNQKFPDSAKYLLGGQNNSQLGTTPTDPSLHI